MKQDVKICIPAYKIAYSVCFFVILSLIRGISSTVEIGIALDANIGLLAAVFCAETYVMELSGKRAEVFSLFSMKTKGRVLRRRLFAEMVYLCGISYIGYFFFYWQQPYDVNQSSVLLYAMYVLAVTGTVVFWGAFSMTLSDLFRNQWAGIGGALALWLVVNSKAGEELLGNFNIFAFQNRDIAGAPDWGWLLGKGAGIFLAGGMIAMIPAILKKRG